MDYKVADYRKIWNVGPYHLISLVLALTPRFFAWVSFLLAVGALKILSEASGSLFADLLYRLSVALFVIYTSLACATAIRYFIQTYKDAISEMKPGPSRLFNVILLGVSGGFSVSVFLLMSAALKELISAIR